MNFLIRDDILKRMMSRAYRELYFIIKNSTDEVRSKIPESFMEYIMENMDVDYEFQIDIDGGDIKLHILDETKALLVSVYKDFLM